MDNKLIAEYYDFTTPFYKYFWHGDSYGIHYGFTDENETKTLQDELLNVNKTLADIAKINSYSKVLDAGCGVGGSSIWLAHNIGCYIIGITISPKQLEKAMKYAEENGVSDRTEFYLKDFLKTEFPDNTFDVVWGIESVCHAKNKEDFLREAFRVLKPGGKLIVADGFLRHYPQNNEEQKLYKLFLEGFILDNLALLSDFSTSMKKIGFKAIMFYDKTKEIQNSSEAMYRMSKHWYFVHILLRAFRLIPGFMVKNIKAGIAQKDFFMKLGMYAVFIGEK